VRAIFIFGATGGSMNIVSKIEEGSPEEHAQEIQDMKELDRDSLARLMHIARIYTKLGTLEYDQFRHPNLLYAFQSARQRFNLWDAHSIDSAIEALTDPTGW